MPPFLAAPDHNDLLSPWTSVVPLCVQLICHLASDILYYIVLYYIYYLALHIQPCITYTALCHIYYLVLHILPCITRLWDIPSPKLQELQAQSWNFFLFSLFVERLKKIENADIPNNQRLTTQTDSRLFKVREKSEELHLSDTIVETESLSFVYYRDHCWQQTRKIVI